MPSKKLTQEVAARVKSGEGRDVIVWDSGLKGFGLICRKNGETKTWIMQRDVAGKTARETLGHFPDMNASAAREKRARAKRAGFCVIVTRTGRPL